MKGDEESTLVPENEEHSEEKIRMRKRRQEKGRMRDGNNAWKMTDVKRVRERK